MKERGIMCVCVCVCEEEKRGGVCVFEIGKGRRVFIKGKGRVCGCVHMCGRKKKGEMRGRV